MRHMSELSCQYQSHQRNHYDYHDHGHYHDHHDHHPHHPHHANGGEDDWRQKAHLVFCPRS